MQPVIAFFTSDAAVKAVAASTLPLVAVLLPLDAAASIMDGGLLAASQTDLLSVIQVGTAHPPCLPACPTADAALDSAL
jgi:Na+-driven multidrug efflux pump